MSNITRRTATDAVDAMARHIMTRWSNSAQRAFVQSMHDSIAKTVFAFRARFRDFMEGYSGPSIELSEDIADLVRIRLYELLHPVPTPA